jgi:cell division cycle 20, cofactor of APC complex
MYHNKEIMEVDAFMARPIESSVLTRWERKARDSKKTASSSTPAACGASSSKAQKTSAFATPGSASRSRSRMGLNTSTTTPGGSLTGRTPSRSQVYGDRFIPNRDAMNSDLQIHQTTNENSRPRDDVARDTMSQTDEFKYKLAESLFNGESINTKILAFKNKAPKPSDGYQNELRVLYSQNRERSQVQRVKRHISTTPERILDAPDLVNDYYLNLLDWSQQNILAVALGPCVYLWNAATGDIELLCESKNETDFWTSIQWTQDGSHLALGTNEMETQIWDISKGAKLRTLKGHTGRVSSLAWNDHVLTSGSRDTNILNNDVRVRKHLISTWDTHSGEVCGLKWSPDGTQLASGSNDNLCCIFDVNKTQETFKLTEHTAAVKALAWCPFQRNVLATGGGTADRHIRFYNTMTGNLLNSVDTKSQVCSLLWSKSEKELLSSHGYSQNQLTVWKYPSMVKVAELTGHTSRVLHTALSSDGTTVCSAAADETLRFWKVWDAPQKKAAAKAARSSSATRRNMMSLNIR